MGERVFAALPPARATILVTGFGGFPGSPRNPTERVVASLTREIPRFLRLGIALRLAVLPVRYDGLAAELGELARRHHPDAWLMLGVAGRRRQLCVETLARNRIAPMRPDAAGRFATGPLLRGGASTLPVTLPVRRILANLDAVGIPSRLSNDAGDYLCNAALYLALDGMLAPAVGFLHVPPTLAKQSRRSLRRGPGRLGVTTAELTRAALAALLALSPAANLAGGRLKLGRSERSGCALPGC